MGHEVRCALPHCAAAGVMVCMKLPGAHRGRARCGASGENFYHLLNALECFQFEDLSHNFFLLFSNIRSIFMYFLLVFVGTR